jgi:hypothetical protein
MALSYSSNQTLRFPSDIYTIIAQLDITTYNLLLAIPRFARKTLDPNAQKQWQSHFIIHSIRYINEPGYYNCPIHEWHLIYRSGKKVLHQLDSPAYIAYNSNGQIIHEVWYRCGKCHQDGNPARNIYTNDGKLTYSIWYKNDLCHRDDGPADTHWKYDGLSPEGRIDWEEWYQNGKVHRNDGPARIEYNSNKEPFYEVWCQYGIIHRVGGFARINHAVGIREYYLDGICRSEAEYNALLAM